MKATKSSTAKGLDALSFRDLEAMNKQQVLTILNGILEWVHEEVYMGRINLIPKINNPVLFGDYRPICVMPLVVRILHRILSKRLSVINHHRFQAGFTEQRSTSENIWLLNAIMESAASGGSSAYLTLLDFQKAFDSVSHNTMVGLLYDLGLLPRLVAYIAIVYARVRLTMGDGWFRQRRGVLQGDLLSPFLFNVVIDYIWKGLSQDIGIKYGGETINVLSYDVVGRRNCLFCSGAQFVNIWG